MEFKFQKGEVQAAVVNAGEKLQTLAKKIGVSLKTLQRAARGENLQSVTYSKIAKFFNLV